jgi:hypothetical protein
MLVEMLLVKWKHKSSIHKDEKRESFLYLKTRAQYLLAQKDWREKVTGARTRALERYKSFQSKGVSFATSRE